MTAGQRRAGRAHPFGGKIASTIISRVGMVCPHRLKIEKQLFCFVLFFSVYSVTK